jgi:tRNA1(Val) A37 N6-methylase TrmN6
VQGIKGSNAPIVLRPGLVLHGAGNRFDPEVEAVLRAASGLSLGSRRPRP